MPWQLPFRNQAIGNLVHMRVGRCEKVITDWLAIQTNAFVDANEMWRGVETDVVSGGAQNGSQRRGRGTLAVSTADQDGRKRPLGMAQRFGEDAHVREVELVRRHLVQFVTKLKESFDGFGIGQHRQRIIEAIHNGDTETRRLKSKARGQSKIKGHEIFMAFELVTSW